MRFGHPDRGPEDSFLGPYLMDLGDWFWGKVCGVIGHRWVDDSHAGPDGATISLGCERCGESFETILY